MNYLPKVLQARAKIAMQQIWMAPSRAAALQAIKIFAQYGAKYPKAVASLQEDVDELLTCYNFPAEHWPSLRTTNPIESTFATIRHRARQSSGCFSRMSFLAMVYKLALGAQKNWRRMKGYGLLGQVELGMVYTWFACAAEHAAHHLKRADQPDHTLVLSISHCVILNGK